MNKPDPVAGPTDEHTGQPAGDAAAWVAHPSTPQAVTSGMGAEVKARRPHRSIALMRLLGAECPSCRGFGCGACANTGLG